jgi:branched-chain amino acid transport system permease protein
VSASPAVLSEDQPSRLRRVWEAGPYGWNRILTRPYVLIPFFVIAALVPFVLQYVVDNFGWVGGAYWLGILTLCVENSALALALTLVAGYVGLLNLGFIAFFGIGSYTYALVASDQIGKHLPLWWALVAVVAVSSLFALLLGVPSLRLRGDYLAIVTLAFGLIIREITIDLDRPPVLLGHQVGPSNFNLTGGTGGIPLVDPLSLPSWFPIIHGRALQARSYYWIFLGFLAISVLLMLRWRNTRPGRAWIAIREDELAARAMGVNVFKYRLLALIASSVMASIVGMIDAAWIHNALPENFDVQRTVLVFIMAVLGGLASVPGAIVGATIVTVLPFVLQQLVFYKYLVFSLVLIVLMVFRPQGLLGTVSLRPRRSMGGTVELFAEPEQAPSSAQLGTMGETAAELEASTGAIVDTAGEPTP